MPQPNAQPILVINSGSSSLKAAMFLRGSSDEDERAVLEANATGIGQTEGKLTIKDAEGNSLDRQQGGDKHDYKSQEEALAKVAESLQQYREKITGGPPVAIGHRIVHGGMHLTRHQKLTPEVIAQLEEAVHFAPLHIPGSLKLIRKAEELYPGTPQFACFDTAFHQTLPEEAWRLPIPREYTDAGVRRYGFHGLSYESIVSQLRSESVKLPERLVVAHLGSGSSLAAIADGRSVDTSMGFTPAGGVPMATRTGDLDPGVLIYLMRSGGLGVDELEALVNHRAGLAALSGGTSDMQKLEEAASGSSSGVQKEAALAIGIFATAVAKTIAGYIVSLGGLDLLVFTGGIGEHSAAFRAAVVERLQPLGLRLNRAANESHASVISGEGSRAAVRVLPAEEDLEIARHVRGLLATAGALRG